MSFDKLPSNYSCYLIKDIDSILEPFKLDDLINESLKCNPKAQRAVLVKIELGLHETKDWSINQRIDKIFSFWEQIKYINSKSNNFGLAWEYSITSAIKETIMGDCFYNYDAKLPDYSLIYYAIKKMMEHKFEEKWMNDITLCYQKFKDK
jgi:hypothetical protein